MFLYLLQISGFFLLHHSTKKFVGNVDSIDNKYYGYPHPAPINGIEKAIDFQLEKAGSKELDITIFDPKNNLAFDVKTGTNDFNLPIIFYGKHGRQAQQFKLIMTSNRRFVLGYNDKCMKYDQEKNGFFTGKCENLSESEFDIYYERKPVPEYIKEDVYKIEKENIHNPDVNTPFIPIGSKRILGNFYIKDDEVTAQFKDKEDIDLGIYVGTTNISRAQKGDIKNKRSKTSSLKTTRSKKPKKICHECHHESISESSSSQSSLDGDNHTRKLRFADKNTSNGHFV